MDKNQDDESTVSALSLTSRLPDPAQYQSCTLELRYYSMLSVLTNPYPSRRPFVRNSRATIRYLCRGTSSQGHIPMGQLGRNIG